MSFTDRDNRAGKRKTINCGSDSSSNRKRKKLAVVGEKKSQGQMGIYLRDEAKTQT